MSNEWFFATSNEQILQRVTSDFTTSEFQRVTSNEWKVTSQVVSCKLFNVRPAWVFILLTSDIFWWHLKHYSIRLYDNIWRYLSKTFDIGVERYLTIFDLNDNLAIESLRSNSDNGNVNGKWQNYSNAHVRATVTPQPRRLLSTCRTKKQIFRFSQDGNL